MHAVVAAHCLGAPKYDTSCSRGALGSEPCKAWADELAAAVVGHVMSDQQCLVWGKKGKGSDCNSEEEKDYVTQ